MDPDCKHAPFVLIAGTLACLFLVPLRACGDTRIVWEYKGGYGSSWFVHEGGKKWVIYRGDGRTFLYTERLRTEQHIKLRGPYTGLEIRLSNEKFESRQNSQTPWRFSARGKWGSRDRLPDHIRKAPGSYQVRLVYFVPPDREPAKDYEVRIPLIMSLVNELLVQDLRRQGFRPKPLEFESDGDRVAVHLVAAKHPSSFYRKDAWPNTQVQAKRIHDELLEGFGDPKRQLTVVFAETYGEERVPEAWSGHIAIGTGRPPEGGFAVYSSWLLKDLFTATTRERQIQLFFDEMRITGRKAFGSRLPNSPRFEFVEDGFGAVLHELGHALGCPHDYREPENIMGGGFRQLRHNLDPSSPRQRRARFSRDNARILMSSRYLATDLELQDFDPPEVEFRLERTGRILTAEIEARDGVGLKALLLRKIAGKASSVVTGRGLSGSKRRITERLDAKLVTGGSLRMEAFVTDVGGNTTRVTASLK